MCYLSTRAQLKPDLRFRPAKANVTAIGEKGAFARRDLFPLRASKAQLP